MDLNSGKASIANWSIVPRLLLRADAGVHRGYGHVMRCLTLGTELRRRGWAVTLLAKDLSPFLANRASLEGISVTRMAHPVGSLQDASEVVRYPADLVVVDGYEFPRRYFKFLDDQSIAYVVIDDDGEVAPHGALLIINQNPHAEKSIYAGHEPGRLQLGAEFAMVRQEVTRLSRSGPRGLQQSRPTVLVSIGGTDIGGLTYGVTEVMLQERDWEVVASLPQPPLGAISAPTDIAPVLSQATVAVIGAGSTLWEACFLGLPSVALIVADNQVGGSQKAASLGACELIDCRNETDMKAIRDRVAALINSPQRRESMSRAGKRLIDGNGVFRVARSIEDLVLRR